MLQRRSPPCFLCPLRAKGSSVARRGAWRRRVGSLPWRRCCGVSVTCESIERSATEASLRDAGGTSTCPTGPARRSSAVLARSRHSVSPARSLQAAVVSPCSLRARGCKLRPVNGFITSREERGRGVHGACNPRAAREGGEAGTERVRARNDWHASEGKRESKGGARLGRGALGVTREEGRATDVVDLEEEHLWSGGSARLLRQLPCSRGGRVRSGRGRTTTRSRPIPPP